MTDPSITSERRPLPALLTIPELARLTGKHRNSVRRLLESAGVPFRTSGRRLMVTTSTLRRYMPDVVEAIEQRMLSSDIAVDTRV